jgi:hypothetical protein
MVRKLKVQKFITALAIIIENMVRMVSKLMDGAAKSIDLYEKGPL